METGKWSCPEGPFWLVFCLKFFLLVLTGSLAPGTEQQLWQRAPSLAGNDDQRLRVSEDAQRYVPFKSSVMYFVKYYKSSERGRESNTEGH